MPWRKSDYLRFIPSLTWQCRPQVEPLVRRLPAGARVVDLGAGGRKITPRTVCVDFAPLPNTDVVADVQRLPFRDGCLDLVFGTGLLEHVEDERVTLAEIARVLRPRGRAHLEVPFLQQHHDDPIDCRRMTVDGLERALARAGLQVEASGVHIGPTVTLATLATYYGALLFEGRSRPAKVLSTAVFLGLSIALWPARYLDAWLVRKPSAHRLAFGVYCTATKLAPSAGPSGHAPGHQALHGEPARADP